MTKIKGEQVDHPKHYNSHPSGIECIEIARYMPFCLGNAFKYVFRKDLKESSIQDLQKSLWYINEEIKIRNEEKWVVWPRDSRYEVSTLGKVKNIQTQEIRKPVLLKSGYLTLNFLVNGKMKCYYIHRMVWESFVGCIPDNKVIRHINGQKSDCSIYNLDIGNYQDNQRDKRNHGTHYFGENNPSSKLTIEEVNKIRIDSRSETQIAKDYNVSRATVGRIKRGESWQNGKSNYLILVEKLLSLEKDEEMKDIFKYICLSFISPNSCEYLESAKYCLEEKIESILLNEKHLKNI